MNHKQQSRLRRTCVAILGAKVVQRGEFDRLCDQVLKPALEDFATQAIYLGLSLGFTHSKPKAAPALLLELRFKDLPRRISAAFVADGPRVRLELEGAPVLSDWRPRLREVDAAMAIDALLDLLRLLEQPDAPLETDARAPQPS